MGKGRFIVNPFAEMQISPNDRLQLQDLANGIIMTNLDNYNTFVSSGKRKVDLRRWKQIKEREKLTVYAERPESANATTNELSGSGLPMILCVGQIQGKLEDLMYGVLSEDLETMRVKASYVDDVSGAAVLDPIVLPTLEDPFQSLIVKWMELDIPFASTSLVKNRDYVYLEGTGFVTSQSGERLGYHLLHSGGSEIKLRGPRSVAFEAQSDILFGMHEHSNKYKFHGLRTGKNANCEERHRLLEHPDELDRK
ncbi:hypothetical protein PHPALM_32000 [Phytophthora palmivora]|uniref:Uncharacterized protein n=1 Tax=Phytophthora palmivora TaxID=4796 RepID=A0A2P4X179_9STRA|nr:hypothetical protein PHPALM_32000 [Phytophthora palmivora]